MLADYHGLNWFNRKILFSWYYGTLIDPSILALCDVVESTGRGEELYGTAVLAS